MKMEEVLTLLTFWKKSKPATATTYAETETVTDSIISDHPSDYTDDDNDNDDDSFFELELTFPNSAPKVDQIPPTTSKTPKSPISVLRSASPKLRDFMLGKLRRKNEFETETDYSSNLSPRRSNSSLFTVKLKIEDGSIVPKFSRSNSSDLFSPNRSSGDDSVESSKRFSKDVVQKYLSLMKPSFVKPAKKTTEKFGGSPARSTSSVSFPSPRKEKEEKEKEKEKMSSRFKVKSKKQLGKSKSSPMSFPARDDHPIDGIEGAILHCKRSLNSTGVSSLSRCSSDPSYEKSIAVSEEI